MFKIEDYHEFSLTKVEIQERHIQLTDELDRYDQLSADLAQSTARQKGLIKASDAKIVKLRNAIKDGKEMIKCEIIFNNPKDGEKTLAREDNEQKVVLDMTEDEVQQHNQTDAFDQE